MKHFYFSILSIIFQVQATPAKASYSPIPLNKMILEADLVVYGEINRVEATSFALRIKKTVIGSPNDTIIKVKQFKDWMCAQRWTKYSRGQQVFLFLKKDADNNWNIMSGGGEGELPVLENNVYPDYVTSLYMPFVKFDTYVLYGAKYSGVKLNLNEFVEAVAGYRNCFRIVKAEIMQQDVIELKCSKEILANYKSKSKLNKWLAEKSV